MAALAASGATALVGLIVSEGFERAKSGLSRSDGDGARARNRTANARTTGGVGPGGSGGDAHAQADVRARLCRRLEGTPAADPGAAEELARLLTESAPSHTSIAPYVDLVRLTVNGGVNHGPVFQR